MDNLAWRHLNVKTIAYADVAGKGAKQIGFDQVGINDATAYSAEDADITLQLHHWLHPRPPMAFPYNSAPRQHEEVVVVGRREGVDLGREAGRRWKHAKVQISSLRSSVPRSTPCSFRCCILPDVWKVMVEDMCPRQMSA